MTIKCRIIQVTANKNVIVSAKPSILSALNPTSLESIKANNLYCGYIDRGARKGVIVKFNERIKVFVGKENMSARNVSFDTYDSVLVFVKSVEGDKIVASLQDDAVFKKPSSTIFNRFVEYFAEEHSINRKFGLGEARKLWNKFRVGNYVETTVELVKDFGVVVKINNSSLTGLLMNEHITAIKSSLKEGTKLIARIIDVDFEKQMVDLIPEIVDEENTKLAELLANQTYNLEKFLKLEVSKLLTHSLSSC